MTRTDTHRPSAINPEEYEFVEFEYLPEDKDGFSNARWRREYIRNHMARTGGTYSRHQHGGNCHICGSVNAIYTALFYHQPTNSYIRTGLECADKLEYGVAGKADAFRKEVKAAREQVAGKRKAKAFCEDNQLVGAYEIWAADVADLPGHIHNQGETYEGDVWNNETHQYETGTVSAEYKELHYEERTIRDIIGKLVKYGSISDNQTDFVRSLLNRIPERDQRNAEYAAKKAAEDAAAQPVPVTDKRITITGEILSTRIQDGGFGPTEKALIKTTDGWKVWGTLPIGEKGDTIRFDARVKVSDDDPKFGYFSRPTKAELVE